MKREKIIKRELEMIDRNLDGEHLNPELSYNFFSNKVISN